ncbi:MAG: hypothetical protein QOJ54_3598 [Aliidongia sp.]|nr:hypothetical protein [Aliidongia sp.]
MVPAKAAPIAEIVAPFDYAALPAADAAALRAEAKNLRTCRKGVTEGMLAIGAGLIRAKARLAHGDWGRWLDAEFGYSQRTARRFMLAAAWAEGKSATVADFDPGVVNLLSAPSTPEAVAQAALDRAAAGEPISAEMLRITIANAKDAKRREAELAKLKPATRRSRARRKEENLRAAEEWRQKTETEKAKAAEAVAFIEEHLGEDFHEFLRLHQDASYHFDSALRARANALRGRPSTPSIH